MSTQPIAPNEEDDDIPSTPTTSTPGAPASLPEDPNHPARWKNRRRMAYIALCSMVMLMSYIISPWVSASRVEPLSSIIDTFYFVMGSIVGGYMGLSTFSAVWNRSTK